MKTICIIPARGGSKRIPKKNIKDFLGKPIIYYSIKKALESKCFDVVMVSTDDQKIKDIALESGAEVPFFRSEKNSGDKVPIKDVLIEVLNNYKKKDLIFEYVCCIFPTAPLMKIENIKLGYDKIENYDYVFAVTPYSFPIQRSFHLTTMSICLTKLRYI